MPPRYSRAAQSNRVTLTTSTASPIQTPSPGHSGHHRPRRADNINHGRQHAGASAVSAPPAFAWQASTGLPSKEMPKPSSYRTKDIAVQTSSSRRTEATQVAGASQSLAPPGESHAAVANSAASDIAVAPSNSRSARATTRLASVGSSNAWSFGKGRGRVVTAGDRRKSVFWLNYSNRSYPNRFPCGKPPATPPQQRDLTPVFILV